MLRITIPADERWDEAKQEFIYTKEQTLQLEHSLVSISKWESKWCKAFLSERTKTSEEVMDYVRCMTLTQNVDPAVYSRLTDENFVAINEYIDAPMTATYIYSDVNSRFNREKVTSELIYYFMIACNIPFECQKWHLNRLLTLIKVCSIKNQPPKSRSKKDIMRRNSAVNAARRRNMNTRG